LRDKEAKHDTLTKREELAGRTHERVTFFMKEYYFGGHTSTANWSKMNQKKIQMIFSSGMISSINVFQLEQRNPYLF